MGKKAVWNIIIAIICIAFIVFLWVKKDILAIYRDLPREQVIPLVIISAAVSLMKAAAFTGAALLIRWIVTKVKGR